ncbi:MAG: hypothetical protein R2798_01845 [Chitinophagales bacterium]|nr:hypothetical protein [Bacteroidota bacterium]MCB9042823.1 hypothetical protein [Chitinophagales bacterium]
MKWKKIKQLYNADGSVFFLQSHAANPVAQVLSDKIVRIYFSPRDAENRAHIASIDFDFSQNFNAVSSPKHILAPGKIGTFDDRGCSMACLANVRGTQYLYYLGWNLSTDVPFQNAIGVLQWSENTQGFERISEGPMMDRNFDDPYSLSYPFVLVQAEKQLMWYGSHTRWGKQNSDMLHPLKYAWAIDGIHFLRSNHICLPTTATDYAFSKPVVLYENNLYKMWYSFRGEKYLIGYAESNDGIYWQRKDESVGISVAAEATAWDSEMLCYPFVFDMKGARYMLYCGNAYGKTGFGLAILETD